jgi:hypothetical protein
VRSLLFEISPHARWKKAPGAAASLALDPVLGARHPETFDPLGVSFCPSWRVALRAERHGFILGRESEVVVRRY